MPVPTEMLERPIDWHDHALWPLLDDLQGNILKGHGRDHTVNHHLSFDEARIADVRRQIRAIAPRITSALRQLNESEVFKTYGRPGSTSVFFMLSATGYAKLGLTPPAGGAFADGMAKRPLADGDSASWEEHLRPGVDALLIVADDSDTIVANAAERLIETFAASGIKLLGRDVGRALRSERTANEPKGRGIEHFGYVDGRSQPLMLAEDLAREEAAGGMDIWDPGFGPVEVALVRDPHGVTADSYGSFLVYRKLEQDVKSFKRMEDELADELGLTDEDFERAGAMVVGRFEDGTPLELSSSATDPNPTPNNFDYDADPRGLRCPIHAHIRKINPRDTEERRTHLMPRRGIPYGERSGPLDDEAHFPTHGVGLIFMAYNQSIERQFEVTQRFWANDHGFPDDLAAGRDPIIGQPKGDVQGWRREYGADGPEQKFEFGLHVKMLGGEYFFAPSRGFLKDV